MNKRAIWTIVTLVGGYVLCQAIADIGATKLVEIAGITMPAGTFIFALTFTLRDLLHKRLGKEWARAAIAMAGVFNVIQAVYLAGMARLPWPIFYAQGEAWGAVFAIVPAVTIGSIVAELISELVDTEVYHAVRDRIPQWLAVVLSNGISLPLDSLIFGSLAFTVLPSLFGADSLPFSAAMSLVTGQIVWKGIVTLVSMPSIYLVKHKSVVKE